jgi:chromosome segregation ATPase
LTDEDRSFLDRVFESIADRKTELLAESRNSARRPAVRRELLATPEGKLQILREELNRREAQVARLSEIWAVRERELASSDDRLHEKEVEIQGLKMQVDDLLRRLSEARDLFVKKDQEHGAAIDSMLLDKFVNEKELIEVVAAKEKDISLLRRDLHARDDELQRQNLELERSREEIAQLERLRQNEFAEYQAHEAALSSALARREVEIMGLGSDLELLMDLLRARDAELDQTREASSRELTLLRNELSNHEMSSDFALRALSEQLRDADARTEMALWAWRSAVESSAADAAPMLEDMRATEEDLREEVLQREATVVQRDGIHQSLTARLEASEAVGRRLALDLTEEHEQAVAREGQLSAELAQRAEHIGTLEGELEAVRHDKEQRETELLGELRHAGDRLEASAAEVSLLTQDVGMARARAEQLSQELDAQRSRFDEAQRGAEAALGELQAERDGLRGEASRLDQELRQTLEEKARSEQELQQQLSDHVDLIGKLQGELAATREGAEAREGTLQAELLAARDEAGRLGEELLGLREDKAQVDRQSADQIAELAELKGVLAAERDAAVEEQSRLMAELEETRGHAEERAAELRAELALRDEAARAAEERAQQQLDEVTRRLETLEQEFGDTGRQLAEEQGRVQGLVQEKQRREEAFTREIAVRSEAAKNAERKIQRQLESEHERSRAIEAQNASQQQQLAELAEKLASAERLGAELEADAQRVTAQREAQRQEWQGQLASRDSRVAELQAALAQLHQDRRKLEEEGTSRIARVEARAKELEGRLAEASATASRQERELQAANQARARKIQELEQSLEAASSARARLERDLGSRSQAAEGKAADLAQKLAQSQRLQRELESRLQKESGEAAARMRAEIERRDTQRGHEVTRLQQALQEKAKALKVMELELQRVKARSSATTPSGRTPVRQPAPTPPPTPVAASEEIDLAELEPMREEVTQIVTMPDLASMPASGRKKDDAEEDLDEMLSKLEI